MPLSGCAAAVRAIAAATWSAGIGWMRASHANLVADGQGLGDRSGELGELRGPRPSSRRCSTTLVLMSPLAPTTEILTHGTLRHR